MDVTAAEPLDRIFVHDYVLEVEIGVHHNEKGVTQRVRFSVDIDLTPSRQELEDDIEHTLDYDYVINGNMIAGFALVAYPAEYGRSGVMTFVVSHQGKVYEKDLGPAGDLIAAAIDEYEPDGSWSLVEE